MLRLLSQFVLAIALAGSVHAAGPAAAPAAVMVYDELADANREVAAALKQAEAEHKAVLMVFGANGCPDCQTFEEEMNTPDLGSTLALNYVVVKIDVGRFKKNLDIANLYGIKIRRGIPAIGIVSTEGKNVTIVTADGPKMVELRTAGRPALVKFFESSITAQKNALSQ